jgi:chloramphenicol 3-O-phosphotransferase
MPETSRNALDAWHSIPAVVRGIVDGLSDAELDRRIPGVTLSRRELVHHVVEANVVAASILVAALGANDTVYDWSWMMPFGSWMDRMRYDRKPISPALALLDAMNAWVVGQIEPLEDGLERRVRLRDRPGGDLRTATVAEILLQEADHAREHAEELRAAG